MSNDTINNQEDTSVAKELGKSFVNVATEKMPIVNKALEAHDMVAQIKEYEHEGHSYFIATLGTIGSSAVAVAVIAAGPPSAKLTGLTELAAQTGASKLLVEFGGKVVLYTLGEAIGDEAAHELMDKLQPLDAVFQDVDAAAAAKHAFAFLGEKTDQLGGLYAYAKDEIDKAILEGRVITGEGKVIAVKDFNPETYRDDSTKPIVPPREDPELAIDLGVATGQPLAGVKDSDVVIENPHHPEDTFPPNEPKEVIQAITPINKELFNTTEEEQQQPPPEQRDAVPEQQQPPPELREVVPEQQQPPPEQPPERPENDHRQMMLRQELIQREVERAEREK
jgi:hypothetical protein